MLPRLPALRRPGLRTVTAGAVGVAAVALTATTMAGPSGARAIDLSAASSPHHNSRGDLGCWRSPSNASCDGVMPSTYCRSDSYRVQPDHGGSRDWWVADTNWSFTTELMYSPHCKSNWAVTYVDWSDPVIPVTFSTKVVRYAGPDGPKLVEHAPGDYLAGGDWDLINSTMVYSPNNLAQAVGTLSTDDNKAPTGEF